MDPPDVLGQQLHRADPDLREPTYESVAQLTEGGHLFLMSLGGELLGVAEDELAAKRASRERRETHAGEGKEDEHPDSTKALCPQPSCSSGHIGAQGGRLCGL